MECIRKPLVNTGMTSLFLLFFLMFGCSFSERSFHPSVEKQGLAGAFEKCQIIGEGTHFLTLKCDMPKTLPHDIRIYALVLDGDGYPLQKVSGYTHDPRLEGRDHLWFYFFLYDPGRAFHHPRESRYVKFIVMRGENTVMEKTVKMGKTWGTKEGARIFDLPSPPDQIPGYLILKDYAFYAKGDFRKPTGYYVEGSVAGPKGQWNRFVPSSEILGEDEGRREDFLAVDKGWLELATGRAHSMKDAVTPAEPYVEGWWDGKGHFHPWPVRIRGFED